MGREDKGHAVGMQVQAERARETDKGGMKGRSQHTRCHSLPMDACPSPQRGPFCCCVGGRLGGGGGSGRGGEAARSF